MKTYETIHQAYLLTLVDIWEHPQYICAPRGLKIREVVDYSFKIEKPVAESIVTMDLERNQTIESYTAKEVALYNSCTNKVEDFAKASKFWEKIANPDGTVNSAYGYLIWENRSHGNPLYEANQVKGDRKYQQYMRTPWSWCVESLKRDKDTRQAILRFSLPEHFYLGNKDMTCTMHGNFLIRDNKLNFSITMRSQDMVLGAVYDWPWFISLMDMMLKELQTTYPDLEKGSYTHFCHSLHVYERNEEMVRKMLYGTDVG